MRSFVLYIRRLFCKHDFVFLDTVRYFYNGSKRPSKIVHVYRCKDCGFIQRIKL